VLASEGFTSVEEVAFVDVGEIASIDGFDEDTASEIQTRAREYLEKIEAEHDEKRKQLGVADELREIPGVTTAMMVTLGEDGVKTIEDFAGYAIDDLVGWKERKDGETKFFPGVLANHAVSRADAEQMVLAARLRAGWITEDELAVEEAATADAAGE
jgi:N utilization substance protein A